MPTLRELSGKVRATLSNRGLKEIPGETADWARIRLLRKDALDYWQQSDQWPRMEQNWEYYRGNFFSPEERQRAKNAAKALLSFNSLPTIVNSATGREAVNRFRPALKGRDIPPEQADPAELQAIMQVMGYDDQIDDPAVANAFSEALRWIDQACDGESEISDAFLDTFVCGVGNINLYMDYMETLHGRLKVSEVRPWQIAWDPEGTAKRNFRDAMWLFSFVWLSEDEIDHLFPDYADEIKTASTDNANYWTNPVQARSKEQRPHYPSGEGFYDPDTKRYQVSLFQEKRRGIRYHSEDPTTREEILVSPKEWRRLKRQWDAVGLREPEHAVVDQWVYDQAWMAGDFPLQKEPEPNSIQAFTYEAITCFPCKSSTETIWFSPVDLGRDPARWESKFISLWVDILSSGPKGATYLETGTPANDDLETFRKEHSRPDGLPIVNDIEKVKFGPGPQYPSGLDSLIQLASGGTWQRMGLNPTSAGMLEDPRRAPFQTVNAIMQANQSVLAMPFDSLRFARRRLAKKYLLYIRDYIRPQDVFRAVGFEHAKALLPMVEPATTEDGAVVQGDFDWNRDLYDRVMEYDLIADDVPSTPNQMIALLQVMTQTDLFAVLQSAGMAPPPKVVVRMFEAAGMPSTMANEWLQEMAGFIAPEQRQAILQQVLSQLPPDLQQAVQAHFESLAQAEQGVVQ